MENKQNGRSHLMTAPIKTNVSKGRYSDTPKQKIRRLFLTGLHFYAKQLNSLTGSKDSRKCISTLRKQGMNIKDLWYNREFPTAPHIKIYWLETDTINRPQSLFLSVVDKLSVNGKGMQQNTIHEPQRIDSILFNKCIPALIRNSKNMTSGKEVNHD